jgi:hypothetical protein
MVQFIAEITDADSIIWNFGDGTVSNEVSPEHAFTDGGTYIVSATVINEASGITSSDTIAGGIRVFPVFQDTVYLNVAEGDLPYLFGSQSLSEEGTYSETYRSINSCDSIVALFLSITFTGIEGSAQGKDDIDIHPNPSQGIFMLSFNNSHPPQSELSVYNMAGLEIFRKMVNTSNHVQIDLSAYEDGLYLIKINSGKRQITRKLILQ